MADDELLAEFLAEGRENLARLEHELLSFEGGGTPEMLAATFRTAHTVKGNAGFFGYVHLQELMHAAEDLLSRIRDGELAMSSPMVSALLDATDAANGILASLAATGGEGAPVTAALIAQLREFGRGAAPAPVATPAPPPRAEPPAAADTAIRVDTAVLDRLVALAGELVLVRNQLLQHRVDDAPLARAIQRLDVVTSDLQASAMQTRMQPIGAALAKLPRVVRDLAKELGKQVRLEISGDDTALDRTLVDAIRDPLTHLVRNAIDHGIESPAQRGAIGKPAEGTLAIRARHVAGRVELEIADDGAGIDVQRVRAKAIERGVIAADATLGDAELVELIFAPGFSTAEKVTSVSGRGVGMDVVRTNIEAVGGRIAIEARQGLGTTILLQLPLTLAIMPVLLVGAGGQRYALPEAALVEVLLVDPAAGERGLELVHGAPVYRRHGELLPLIGLAEALAGLPPRVPSTPAYVAVVALDGRKLGLVIDELHDSEEIVVKPLDVAAAAPCFSGATVLGDGRVALIVDVAQLAGELGMRGTSRRAQAVADEPAGHLIVRGHDRRLAIPLADVARLEHFAPAAIEHAGRLEVVQYHGRLLPLVRLGDARCERIPVIVHDRGERPFGVVVDAIVDVHAGRIELERATATDGVRGSAVIDGFTTDVLDLVGLAAAAGLEVA